MKTIQRILTAFLLAAILFAETVTAQSYTLHSYETTYEHLVGAVSISNGDRWDDPWYEMEMPIDFYFYNQPVDSIFIADGYITFDQNGERFVSALLADLIDLGYDEEESLSPISWTIEEEFGVDVLKIEWAYAGFYDEYDAEGYADQHVSFQIWLFEGTDDIEFHYGPRECLYCDLDDYEDPTSHVGIGDEQLGEIMLLNGVVGIQTVSESWNAYMEGFPIAGYAFWFQPNGSCSNGLLDDSEDDVDCGSSCFACHCSNGIQDFDEEGIDCGGSDCSECPFLSCGFDNDYAGDISVPSVVGNTTTYTQATAGDYFVLTDLVVGNTYEISTCGSDDFDTQLSLFDAAASFLDYNDDFENCGLSSVVFYTAESTDPVHVLLDEYGCEHDSIEIDVSVTLLSGQSSGCGGASPQICVVTFDPITNKNVVVWEQAGGPVDRYKVYRETNTADKFDLLGTVGADQISIYTDLSGNPYTRPYKYRISSVDSCGIESPLSPVHQTLLLQSNQGINDNVNLIWSGYKGLNFGSYVVWRVSDVNGEEVLDTLPSSLTFYTDASVPVNASLLYYQLEMLGDVSCQATPKKGAASYNSARSNTVQIIGMPVSTEEFESTSAAFKVYPNPVAGDAFSLDWQGENGQLQIKDALSRVVRNLPVNQGVNQINVEDLPAGVYSLQISTSETAGSSKLIIH